MSSKPIRCRVLLGGGLGNQLFQYAYGRALSLRSGAQLELDAVSLFAIDERYRRSYELDGFNLPSELRVIHEPTTFFARIWQQLERKWGERRPLNERAYFYETKHGTFDPDFAELCLRRSCIVQGYWHCPRYFDGIEPMLRRDLNLSRPIHPCYQGMAEEIESTASVGIHVRRQDFWSKLSITYYHEAIKRLQNRFADLRFFLFSDDPDWWRREAETASDVRYVRHPEATVIDDFQLLTRCRHFIIANSSFSWWAAWLGEHPHKHVVAPSKDIWFNSWEVLPDDWEIVPVHKDAASRQPGVTTFNFIPK